MSTTTKRPSSFGQMARSFHLAHTFGVLDEFQSMLDSAWAKSEKRLRTKYEGLSPDGFQTEHDMEEYRTFLEDEFYQLGEVKKLCDTLSIAGLYLQVETQVKRVLGSTFPEMSKRNIAKVLRGEAAEEIDCTNLAGFDAVNELRMLNNIIKHAGSKADDALALKYPVWVANEELVGLDKAYERLKPLVKAYLRAFTNEAYDRSDLYDDQPHK